MNYAKIYEQLIERAQSREIPDCYCEIHHIVPRCLYGSNDDRNLVALTAREHFIAHWLLSKIHKNNNKLLFAVSAFMTSDRLNSRQFEIARVAGVKARTGENNPMLGRKHSAETKAKIGAVHRGKTESAETRQRKAMARRGKKSSDETRAKLSVINKGRTVSEVTRAKLAACNIGKKIPKVTCLGCKRVIASSRLTYHSCLVDTRL